MSLHLILKKLSGRLGFKLKAIVGGFSDFLCLSLLLKEVIQHSSFLLVSCNLGVEALLFDRCKDEFSLVFFQVVLRFLKSTVTLVLIFGLLQVGVDISLLLLLLNDELIESILVFLVSDLNLFLTLFFEFKLESIFELQALGLLVLVL